MIASHPDDFVSFIESNPNPPAPILTADALNPWAQLTADLGPRLTTQPGS
ncbi:MAG: hypothetical protein OEM97_03180 [Acidimicrobiia bacterium]|nr:hypothetical protein [Acidimicrobiia bacterium]